MVVQESQQIIAFGLDFKELLMVVGLFFGSIGLLFKLFFTSKYERFTKGKILTAGELAMMQAEDKSEQLAKLPQDEQEELRRGYSFHLELEQIKAQDWSQKYNLTLKKLLMAMDRMFGDKLHYPGKPKNFSERWFGTNVFTAGSYAFCLRLAIVYPMFFAFLSWLVSGQLTIGGLVFIEQMPFLVCTLCLLGRESCF